MQWYIHCGNDWQMFMMMDHDYLDKIMQRLDDEDLEFLSKNKIEKPEADIKKRIADGMSQKSFADGADKIKRKRSIHIYGD